VRTSSSLRSDHYLPGLGAATNWIHVIVYRSNMLEGVRLGSHGIVEHHRSSWAFALEQLRNLHTLDGITFDDFVEKKFSWAGRASAEYALPYTEPWVGIVHNPPGSLTGLTPTSRRRSLFYGTSDGSEACRTVAGYSHCRRIA
jgi:hypothetical protein